MTVTSNNLLILDSIIKEYKKQKSDITEDSELFELFASEQILKDYTLSDEEIQSGIIDGGDDGGIDAIYLFVNGQLCTEEILLDENITNFKTNNTKISLYIIQSKISNTFKETAVKFILSTMKDFFDLEKELLSSIYKDELIQKRNIFRDLFLALSPFHPSVDVNFAYCTKGSVEDVNCKITNTIEQILEDAKKTGITSNVKFNLLGALELINLNRILPQYKLPLRFQEVMNLKDSYILLVKIKDYYEFLQNSDKDGIIRDYLFEANIRDHQGNVSVNKDIKSTLESAEEMDTNFWWLNNGVTIIASDATIAGSFINLDRIQIVNGLQTSYSIFESFENILGINKEKELLVRIILTSEDDFRTDKIIKATNSQTPLSPYSFRASDAIQRNIEDYLKSKNLFYDRRKNYYKNIGKNAEQIISIQYMAQVINAIVLKSPHTSRSAPGSLVKKDNSYNKIFGFANIELYAKSVSFMKRILNTIKLFHSDDYKRHEKLDFQYHIGFKVLQNKLGPNYTDIELLTLDLSDITEENIINSMKIVIDNARKKALDNNSTILAIAKSKEFTDFITNL